MNNNENNDRQRTARQKATNGDAKGNERRRKRQRTARQKAAKGNAEGNERRRRGQRTATQRATNGDAEGDERRRRSAEGDERRRRRRRTAAKANELTTNGNEDNKTHGGDKRTVSTPNCVILEVQHSSTESTTSHLRTKSTSRSTQYCVDTAKNERRAPNPARSATASECRVHKVLTVVLSTNSHRQRSE